MNTIMLSNNARFSPSILAVYISTAVGLSTPMVLAQETTGVANTPAHTAMHSYNIAAQPLSEALIQFGQQSGLQVTASSALVEGKQSSAVKGSMTTEQALDRLLEKTGLQYNNTGGMVSLIVASSAPNNNPGILPTVKVQAAAEMSDGSSAQGYRNDVVSAVGPWQGRKLQDVPYSVTTVSKELIENLQATAPDQVFRINPTTQLSRAQYEVDNPYVLMRGFTVSTSYRDGLQGDGYGYGTTTEDAERIEILTGLSGFLYGPGNVGGLVNYVSKQPTAERLTRLAVGNNGRENWYAHGDFGGPIDDAGRFGYRINAVRQEGDTAIENMNIEKTFISGVFDWHLSDTLRLQVNASDREYDVYGNQPYWSFAPGVTRPSASKIDTSISFSQPWTRKYSEVQRYGANVQWTASDVVSFRAAWRESAIEGGQNAAFNRIDANGNYNQTISDFVAPSVDPMLWQVDTSVGSAFTDFNFATGSIQHKLSVGVQYVTSEQERYSNGAPDIIYNGLSLSHPTYFDRPVPALIDRGNLIKVAGSTNTTWIIGDDIHINERWSALVGVAHSTIETDEITGPIFPSRAYDDSAVTPTLSLIYKPVEFISLYTSYMESLERGGIPAEEYRGYPVVNPWATVEPLVSSQIEFGAKATLGGILLTAAVFEIDKGLQYYDLTDPTKPRYVQDGRQAHQGIEFTVIGKVTERLTLIGGFTQLDAQVKKQKQNPALEGKRPAQVAETMAKLRAEYEVPGLPALTLLAGVNYTGNRYSDQTNIDKLPEYTLLDAGARYTTNIAQYPLTLRFEINNLTDEQYWSNASQTGMPLAAVFSVSLEL